MTRDVPVYLQDLFPGLGNATLLCLAQSLYTTCAGVHSACSRRSDQHPRLLGSSPWRPESKLTQKREGDRRRARRCVCLLVKAGAAKQVALRASTPANSAKTPLLSPESAREFSRLRVKPAPAAIQPALSEPSAPSPTHASKKLSRTFSSQAQHVFQ